MLIGFVAPWPVKYQDTEKHLVGSVTSFHHHDILSLLILFFLVQCGLQFWIRVRCKPPCKGEKWLRDSHFGVDRSFLRTWLPRYFPDRAPRITCCAGENVASNPILIPLFHQQHGDPCWMVQSPTLHNSAVLGWSLLADGGWSKGCTRVRPSCSVLCCAVLCCASALRLVHCTYVVDCAASRVLECTCQHQCTCRISARVAISALVAISARVAISALVAIRARVTIMHCAQCAESSGHI
jgi:hypothetical protein